MNGTEITLPINAPPNWVQRVRAIDSKAMTAISMQEIIIYSNGALRITGTRICGLIRISEPNPVVAMLTDAVAAGIRKAPATRSSRKTTLLTVGDARIRASSSRGPPHPVRTKRKNHAIAGISGRNVAHKYCTPAMQTLPIPKSGQSGRSSEPLADDWMIENRNSNRKL